MTSKSFTVIQNGVLHPHCRQMYVATQLARMHNIDIGSRQHRILWQGVSIRKWQRIRDIMQFYRLRYSLVRSQYRSSNLPIPILEMFRTHIYNTCQPFEMLPSILGAEVILYLADELPQSRVIILTITIRNQVDDKRRRARCSSGGCYNRIWLYSFKYGSSFSLS